MKELRSVVNAVAFFLVFLLLYSFLIPGHVKGGRGGPRFIRMTVVDSSDGHPEKMSFSVPFSFVRGGLKFAAMGRMKRELDFHFSDVVEAEEVRDVWTELSGSPEGTEVVREKDEAKIVFSKRGGVITMTVTREEKDETVKVRFPARLMEAVASDDKDLDVAALLEEIPSAEHGDLVEINGKEGHVRVWVE